MGYIPQTSDPPFRQEPLSRLSGSNITERGHPRIVCHIEGISQTHDDISILTMGARQAGRSGFYSCS